MVNFTKQTKFKLIIDSFLEKGNIFDKDKMTYNPNFSVLCMWVVCRTKVYSFRMSNVQCKKRRLFHAWKKSWKLKSRCYNYCYSYCLSRSRTYVHDRIKLLLRSIFCIFATVLIRKDQMWNFFTHQSLKINDDVLKVCFSGFA